MAKLTAAQYAALIELRDAVHRAIEMKVIAAIADEITERDSITDFLNGMSRLVRRERGQQ